MKRWIPIGVIVAAALSGGILGAEMPASFGKPVRGLASRLVCDRNVYEQGQNIWLHLDAFNASDKPVGVAWSPAFEARFHITNERGEEPKPREAKRPEDVGRIPISPGKQAQVMLLFVNGNQYARYDPLPPGRYRAIWKPETEEAEGALLAPDSNAVTFQVIPKTTSAVVPNSAVNDVPWGDEKGGLQTRLRASHNKFYAGEPIPVVVEMRNVGHETLHYLTAYVFGYGGMEVLDGSRKPVRYTGGTGSFGSSLLLIKPGETAILREGNLAGSYFLLKPGKYTARFPGTPGEGRRVFPEGHELPAFSAIPATPLFAFEVLPSGSQDRYAGALIELERHCPKGWDLVARKPASYLGKPGRRWGRVPCRRFSFENFPPSGLKRDLAVLNLCITAEMPMEESWEVPNQANAEDASSEYLGPSAFGHVFLQVPSELVLKRWPRPADDIRNWLAVLKITQGHALEIAREKLQKEAFAGEIDANRMTVHYRDYGPTGKARTCWVIDFARRGAGEITPGQWVRGYWVVVDPETGAIIEATEYER